MTKQQEAREEISKEVLELYKNSNKKSLLVELPTGSGKGKIVADCINNCKSSKKWIILVPEIVQIENYKNDLKKHGLDHLLNTKIENIICYASISKYEDSNFNIALNEAHHISEARLNVLKSIQYDRIIADSATINSEIYNRLQNLEDFDHYKIDFDEAVNIGLIPEPTFYVYSLELDNKEKKYEYKFKQKKSLLSAKEYYNKLSDNINYWRIQYGRGKQKWQESRMLAAGMTRKRFLSSLKTDKAKEIISKLNLENKRFVCFCGSIEQAKLLGNDNVISSENNKNLNKEIIENFNKLKINSIFACSMGIEGMNYFNIDAGINIQLDGQNLENMQKLGRSLRSKNPEFYLIYIKETQDQTYIKDFFTKAKIKKEKIVIL